VGSLRCRAGGGYPGVYGAPAAPIAPPAMYAAAPPAPVAPVPPTPSGIPQPGVNTTVFVGGVGPGVCSCHGFLRFMAGEWTLLWLTEVDERLIRSMFETIGPVYSVKIPVGKNCAFVQYMTPQQAEIAISSLNSQVVRVSLPVMCAGVWTSSEL
jgi:RNA recognition motif-containing protein